VPVLHSFRQQCARAAGLCRPQGPQSRPSLQWVRGVAYDAATQLLVLASVHVSLCFVSYLYVPSTACVPVHFCPYMSRVEGRAGNGQGIGSLTT
jgi:hypothetical protein